MKNRAPAAIMVLVVALTSPANATTLEAAPTEAPTPPMVAEQTQGEYNPLLIGGVAVGLLSFLIVVGTFAWWRDSGYTGWSWRDTGFFGRKTYMGGADKTGHAMTCYTSLRVTTQTYEWLGAPHTTALVVASLTTLVLSNLIEVVDGFTSFGFEWPDVVANLAGQGFGMLLESFPALDALLGMRMAYIPSAQFLKGEKSYLKLVNDYSGMIFYLDFKLAGLEQAFEIAPGAARFFNVGINYSTDGYEPRHARKRRSLGVYVGLNMPEVLDALLGPDTRGVGATRSFLKYYALPFTSVGYHHDFNQVQDAVNFGLSNRMEL